MRAVLFGSSGLVGSELCEYLCKVYEEVICPVRQHRPSRFQQQTTIEIDFNNLHALQEIFNADDLFYCLGTTLKKEGSVKKFMETEVGLAKNILSLARDNGVRRVFLISSQGAKSTSRFPYLKAKGEIEEYAQSLNFDSLVILRPSLLIGNRSEKRLIESLFQKALNPILTPLQNYIPQFSPVSAKQVAHKMFMVSQSKTDKEIILENADIIED